MTGSILLLLPVLLLWPWPPLTVDGHPTDFMEDKDDDDERSSRSSWSLEELVEGNGLVARRDQALEKLQEVLGIRSHAEKTGRRKVPPQFMMELYNNVADPSGVTRGRNPYNAKVVRSFVERDSSMSRFYFFNVSGLEINESVLEAELHLYRKRTPLKAMHPSTLASPYYLIRVYQVLDERSFDVPDLHRLLNVRYVGAHASGWQIFNVKQAVLAWLSGQPNLGLLVTASTLFEDQVSIEFSRRNEYHHSKQPILVLFDDDVGHGRDEDGSKERGAGRKVVPRYYTYDNDNEIAAESSTFEGEDEDEGKFDPRHEYGTEGRDKRERRRGQPEEARWESANESEYFQRQKRTRSDESTSSVAAAAASSSSDFEGEKSRDSYRMDETTVAGRRRRNAALSRKRSDARFADLPTSMDIYEGVRRKSMSREKRTTKSHATIRQNVTECTRHELYVDFKEIGLSSSIIAPLGYSAYHCKGVCESPLSQDQQPTNHATIQGIVHKMDLVKGVERPCCVPTKLLGTTILFFDDNENVVLKVYQDMIADRCGCR